MVSVDALTLVGIAGIYFGLFAYLLPRIGGRSRD